MYLPDRKETSYSEFFTRLCQSLVKVLDEITVDGFVFRTDIRLRPFGDSGAIIMTFDGMENYYQTQATGMGTLCDDQGASGRGRL